MATDWAACGAGESTLLGARMGETSTSNAERRTPNGETPPLLREEW